MARKNIKVYLQKPFGIADSAYYKYLREGAPKGIEYIEKTKSGLVGVGKFGKSFWLKQFVKKCLRFFSLSLPNVYYSDIGNFDIVHCVNCMSKNDVPWICDMEHIGHFWRGSCARYKVKVKDGKVVKLFDDRDKDKVRKYICFDNCKKIIAWSEWTKNNIVREFPEIKNKVEVVYPAVSIKKFKKKNSDGKIRIIFIGRDFKTKGGEIALQVLDKLTKKYSNIEGLIISEVPQKFLNKYSGNKKIKFIGLVSQEKLFKDLYSVADIFLYPTFSDTFGFAILEAQSFGIPVVTMKTGSTHTINETVTDGKTGFIIENMKADGHKMIFDAGVADEFVNVVGKLIEDGKLLRKMSRASFGEVVDGKFSVRERGKKLKMIYKEALR